MTAAAFRPLEIGVASAGAIGVQIAFFSVVALAGSATIAAKEDLPPALVPIKVMPVLDDAPLLKLGGKRKTKLPDMWVKREAVKRVEEASAPSPQAAKTPEAIPTSKLAEKDAEAPPPDAQIAKQVDDDIKALDATTPEKPPDTINEGHADGVKEGTEKDPLKARAVSEYRLRIIAWFNSRFHPPSDIPCEELRSLSAGAVAMISADGTVTSASLMRPSGNGSFDAQAEAALAAARGQQIPPPPKNYPDVRPPNVSLNFNQSHKKCDAAPPSPVP